MQFIEHFTIQVEISSIVQAVLDARGIPTFVYYPVLLSQQPALVGGQNCVRHCSQVCRSPVAQELSKRVLMHPYLSEVDQKYIAEPVAGVLKHNSSQKAAF